jgi:hypothetical protein
MCENQEWFDRRYKDLDDINAIRFVSYKPAIGPLKIGAARQFGLYVVASLAAVHAG